MRPTGGRLAAQGCAGSRLGGSLTTPDRIVHLFEVGDRRCPLSLGLVVRGEALSHVARPAATRRRHRVDQRPQVIDRAKPANDPGRGVPAPRRGAPRRALHEVLGDGAGALLRLDAALLLAALEVNAERDFGPRGADGRRPSARRPVALSQREDGRHGREEGSSAVPCSNVGVLGAL
jgi:hypothetical protein